MSALRMFVNGQAMSGGSIHSSLEGSNFLGPARTAVGYRFFSVRDEFPGLLPDPTSSHYVVGELYEIFYDQLRDQILPNEPPELELTVVKLFDSSGSMCMRIREESITGRGVLDITDHQSWVDYLESQK